MSLDAIKRAIAASLLHLLATPKEALAEDGLLTELKMEGHRPSDLKAALYEMRRDGLVQADKHTEYYRNDSPMANVPDGVFSTGYQNPEPLKSEWVVIRPLPPLAEWWECRRDASHGSATDVSAYGRESQGPQRVIEFPLGGPGNKNAPANEERADAGRDQGGAGQDEGKKATSTKKPLEVSNPKKANVYARILAERRSGKKPTGILETLKSDKDFCELLKAAGNLKLSIRLIRAAVAWGNDPKRKNQESPSA